MSSPNLPGNSLLARAISGQHIDKTSMVRLATAFIKLHHLFGAPRPIDYYGTRGTDNQWTNNHLELLDCFFVMLDPRGDVLYVSETISIYLGLSQVEMTGNAIFEYIHQDDLEQFKAALHYCGLNWPQMCNVRLKSSLTKRANKDTIRASPGYKVLKMEIAMYGNVRLIACYPMPTMVLSTVAVPRDSFVIITTIDLKISHADERAEQLLGNFSTEKSLKGVSFYTLVNVSDVEIVRKMHYEAFKIGACRTPYYRMIRNMGSRTVYVESDVFRYTSSSSTKTPLDTITIVCSLL
ncbi:unnamed protein product [Caenorhabditis auriculariae]|uniref:PAS domain-containing protein n=1 Tax=Caenorhabditis auriculariae TaxID=2777116 RepID=A0A8S1H2I8_9PELO|nr:unnamed protein product [Caenorhabditis auriculariae]